MTENNAQMALIDLNRIESFELPINDQYQSPLFSKVPGEVRDVIFEYALTDYEDLSQPYDLDTCYRRPGYMGPRKTDTALLRTCQAIYHNAWYMPWTQAQHTFFVTANDRRPTKVTDNDQMTRTSALIDRLHADVPVRRKQVSNVQVFAQLYMLEDGRRLSEIFSIPHFRPRTVTLTLRHTDIWYWETDQPIQFKTPWVGACRFPSSVSTFRSQIESTERRKEQVDHVAERARRELFFQRSDGVHLVSDTSSALTVTRWTGSSTWPTAIGQNLRWIRDEIDSDPGMLHYHLVTIVYKPISPTADAAGCDARNRRVLPGIIDVDPMVVAKTQVTGRYAHITTRTAEAAGATSSTPASEALRLVLEFQQQQQENRLRMFASRQASNRRPMAPP